MATVQISVVGTSPLLMHNPQMVDPENEINRQIKALTGKRKKTDEDLRTVERLEWYGGLYTERSDNGPVIVQPASKLRKCLINTARISRLGKQIERALHFRQVNIPLAYEGPREIDELFADKQFTSRLSVGVGQKRVMRVRPEFMPWALVADAEFVEDAMNYDDLERIVELAGTVEGIGDNRVNGYGRFKGTVERV